MGTFLEQATLLENEDFIKKVKIATKQAATFISNENINVNKLTLAEKRSKLAYQILNGDMTKIFAEAIVSSNVNLDINSDEAISNSVSAVFNAIAGVKQNEV